jgi:YcxB-like protein
MLPEPHNKPHSVATNVRPFDLGYAALYSRWVELSIYFFPAALLLGALFGFVAFKVGVSMDASAATGGITLLVAIAAFRIGQQLDPVYQNWKSVRAKTTAHIFTADGVELASANGPTLLRWTSISKVVETKKGFLFYRDGKLATFLPSRNLEGPAEAELIRKFIRKMVADATLRG